MTIQEILEAHEARILSFRCACGVEFNPPNPQGRPALRHRAHVAEVLDKHMQERESEAFAKGQASVKRGYNAFGESFDDPANPYETESNNGR